MPQSNSMLEWKEYAGIDEFTDSIGGYYITLQSNNKKKGRGCSVITINKDGYITTASNTTVEQVNKVFEFVSWYEKLLKGNLG